MEIDMDTRVAVVELRNKTLNEIKAGIIRQDAESNLNILQEDVIERHLLLAIQTAYLLGKRV